MLLSGYLEETILDTSKQSTSESSLFENALRRTPQLSGHFDSEIRRELEQRLFESIENHSWHNSYDQEIRELGAIEAGDTKMLEKSWKEFAIGTIGTMAPDSLRNEKNNGIVVVTNSSRAAIRGGLSPEVSFTLSDIYICKIELVTTPGDAMKLARDAEFLYASLVHDLKSEGKTLPTLSNEHVEKCKDYIFRHLHEKISVFDIAEAIELNPDYLSSLFKKNEGISLSEYLSREKISLAKNLLIYSNYTYSEIANYLGFSSQSHLGEKFRKIAGYTLKEYRIKYQMKDFLD